MKKLAFIVTTFIALTIASCGGNNTQVASETADTTLVDTAEVDSIVEVDTLVVDTIAE